ncbi:3-isopropylmalate dehydratase small subunit [Virgibacillus ihumii]|uniref:3-isopropylmalate dehydratase small subunit n=1 Tax=Virgibacillus ihumii TaxID=2686091 RepID=UPI00157C299A|nr:3-isopropylmalate dehydratase small subunit [Virgibacillus ihumii]
MEAIQEHTGSVLPLNRSNIDTDQIIPKQFLKRVERTGFGQFLFYNWRYDEDGNEREDFNLNKAQFAGSSILLAGENFGCGSSREHAPWSLLDYGFKVIIAPSFADIFYNNALKNGIIPVKMDEAQVNEWLERAETSGLTLDVNLATEQIMDEGQVIPFSIDPYHKEKLMNGWDDIALTLKLEEKISQFETKGV